MPGKRLRLVLCDAPKQPDAWSRPLQRGCIDAEVQYACPIMYWLPARGLLLAHEGEAERAVELYEMASRYPLVARSRWLADVAGAPITAATAGTSREAVAGATASSRAWDIQARLTELLAEL